MGKIAIVTDSSANLPEELVREHHISVIPIWLHWNGQALRDEIDIRPEELYRRLREDKSLPTTSAPSVGDFLRTYARLSKQAEAIISIHLPANLSAVYLTATTAARLVEEVAVHVVDCRSAAMGQGFIVLEAARAAEKGASVEEVLARIEELIPRVNVFATLDTLEYLHRGGRIGAAAALVGSMLRINPILYIYEGHVGVLGVPRTRKRAIRRMVEIMEERVGSRPVHAAVMHADSLEEAESLRQEVARRFHCLELYVTEFTPVMGAHAGPGVLGLAFWSE